MNAEEYLQKLQSLTEPKEDGTAAPEQVSEMAPDVLPEELPFGDFYGDDFLCLLYRSPAAAKMPLQRVIQHLRQVSDESASDMARAQSALFLGRFIEGRTGREPQSGSSDPLQWYELATQFGSVMGAWSQAKLHLSRHESYVQFDMAVSPFPQLVYGDAMTAVGLSQAQNAWLRGIRCACPQALSQFKNWDVEARRCALACIVNYLVLFDRDSQHVIKRYAQPRVDALTWIRPLWDRLIEATSKIEMNPEVVSEELLQQQAAVIVFLEDWATRSGREDVRVAPSKAGTPPSLATDEIVMMPRPFADSSDRGEAGILKQYEVLAKPMRLTALPDLHTLAKIRQTLETEFPWALDAISVVMTDLTARRRHGVTRLGAWPVLMVGKPGTGKTRLAQRLSDLLGTPNTIINMAGMRDTHTFKGVSRGWSGSRPSRMVEFIAQCRVPNPLFVLDELDKARGSYGNGGDPIHALLDLLETGNAKRFQDIFLMTEVDLSHCLYIATANSLAHLSEPLLSRFRLVHVPPPGPEHAPVIAQGILRDIERQWGLPQRVLFLTPAEVRQLAGLGPREMRQAIIELFGQEGRRDANLLH